MSPSLRELISPISLETYDINTLIRCRAFLSFKMLASKTQFSAASNLSLNRVARRKSLTSMCESGKTLRCKAAQSAWIRGVFQLGTAREVFPKIMCANWAVDLLQSPVSVMMITRSC